MRVLITGASKGLGLVLTVELGEHEITRFSGDYFEPHYHGEQDAVIHCAGGGMGYRDALLTHEQLYQLFMLNLGTGAEINKAVIPGMISRNMGRVIHVLSIAAGEAVGSVGYNTVKTALAGYVRSLGRELAGTGVVVAGISPGAFEAPSNAMERLKAKSPEAYSDYLNNRLPRHRMGNATEIVPLIKFLLSDKASMMAGSIIPIDAGEGHYYS